MRKSVVGEWAEGDAFGTTLRGWRALLTLNNSGDRAFAGKEGCPIRGPIGSTLLDAPRIRPPRFITATGNTSQCSLDLTPDLDWNIRAKLSPDLTLHLVIGWHYIGNSM
jgi:hypothetical protein